MGRMELDEPLGTITREEYRRRNGTNGHAPKAAEPDGPTCEVCGVPVDLGRRYCSVPHAAAGARQAQRDRRTRTGSEIGLLVAQVIGVAGVGEVEVTMPGVRLLIRTRPKE